MNVDERAIKTAWTDAGHKRKAGRFLKGPILVALLQGAARLPGVAFQVYIAARHRADLNRSETVTLPTGYLRGWGVSPDAKLRALMMLERAGLIRVERPPGKTSRVTLLGAGEAGQ